MSEDVRIKSSSDQKTGRMQNGTDNSVDRVDENGVAIAGTLAPGMTTVVIDDSQISARIKNIGSSSSSDRIGSGTTKTSDSVNHLTPGFSTGMPGFSPGTPVTGVSSSSLSVRVSPSNSSLSSSGSATGNPRNKVALAPGHSLIDWVRLGKTAKDLTGVGGKLLRVTTEELAAHNKREDAWTVIRGMVYNITPYMDFHPGGVPELMRAAGIDGTDLFNEVHQWVNYESLLSKCIVGKFVSIVHIPKVPAVSSRPSSTLKVYSATLSSSAVSIRPPSESLLEPTGIAYRQCTLISCDPVTHDTNLYGIKRPSDISAPVPIGHHIFISAAVHGTDISHAYTVVPRRRLIADSRDSLSHDSSSSDDVIYLMIKTYSDGLLTPIIRATAIGDTINISTTSAGDFMASQLDDLDDLVMYAAGTGFTPMAALIAHCIQHQTSREQYRKVKMIFFNKEERDILWKADLDLLSSTHAWFTVHYILSKPSSDWTGLTGRIRHELLEPFLPPVSSERKILLCVCGPTQFTQETLRLAKELGYSEAMIHAFFG